MIRKSTCDDRTTLASFIYSQYKNANEFAIAEGNVLNATGTQLLVEINQKIICVMQYDIIRNISKLQSAAMLETVIDFAYFPTCYLSKAATHNEFRNIGLNSLLRYYIISNLSSYEDIRSLAGTIYQGAPRERLLRDLGYIFTEVIDSHLSGFISNRRLYFVHLLRNNFEKALKILKNETIQISQKFNVILEDNISNFQL